MSNFFVDHINALLYKCFHTEETSVQTIAHDVRSLWMEQTSNSYKSAHSWFDSVVDELNYYYNNNGLKYKLRDDCNSFLLFKKMNCFNDQFEACVISAFIKKHYDEIVVELNIV